MVLSVSAGSGHTRAAEALTAVCEKDERVGEVLHVDALAHTNKVFQEVYSKAYIEAVKKAPALWAIAFEETDVPWHKQRSLMMMQRLNAQPLVKKIREFAPDICLCTHFMPSDIISHMIREDKLHTALGVVVTDYYVHATWLADLFTRYFVGKEESRKQLEMLRFQEDRITVSGIPVHPDFCEPMERAELLAKHGLTDDRPIILLSAGTFGVMPARDIFKMLGTICSDAQVIIICGKNEKLKGELEAHAGEAAARNLNYHIFGFTTEMHELMFISDLYIGKPGGLTTAECLASGLPMIVWDPIPGQELYNTSYLLENGAAVAPDTATIIGYKVDQILQTPGRLDTMCEAVRRMAHPRAAYTIVDTMIEKAHESPVKVFRNKKH
jgi:processive 1,2-diacylglycerol beta-glucosyltransferase